MAGKADLRSALAAGAIASEYQQTALLRSIVEVARRVFGAKASSIMLHDADAEELVFAAVAGEGSRHLVGKRVPDGTGIAGWVLASRQPIAVEDVASDQRFARDAAEATGYVPHSLMAAPILLEDRARGVLSVLDRPESSRLTVSETELLGHLAHQASLALDLADGARRARAVLDRADSALPDVVDLADAITRLDEAQREDAQALLGALRRLLDTRR